MKGIDQQLQRLLRAAGGAPVVATEGEVYRPDARRLLAARLRHVEGNAWAVRVCLRIGLATACLLLMVTLLLNLHQVKQVNAHVFELSEGVLTRLTLP